ncbi:hypothetical protein Scep_025985 [Stephania cephalantha]|uniref:Uncharacterized protein n=1 Tax=Stephania cephalantha TaxID=152367 RepID=A0AAP0HS26_9MAGN
MLRTKDRQCPRERSSTSHEKTPIDSQRIEMNVGCREVPRWIQDRIKRKDRAS